MCVCVWVGGVSVCVWVVDDMRVYDHLKAIPTKSLYNDYRLIKT